MLVQYMLQSAAPNHKLFHPSLQLAIYLGPQLFQQACVLT